MIRPLSLLFCLLALAPSTGLAQSVFGTNLIVNGDAESGAGVGANNVLATIPGWTSSGANVITYASGYGIQTTDIVPVAAGKNYFSNGNSSSSMTQTVSFSAAAGVVDAGTATYDSSGYFGGYSDDDDAATMSVAFLNASGASLSSISIGGVKSADRYGTGLYLRRQIGAVPVGARSAKVTLSYVQVSGQNNSGADNLSLIINSPAASPTIFGHNLIIDGDAESSLERTADPAESADIPFWVRTNNFTAITYGVSGSDLDYTSPAPPDQGKLYFYGGSSNPASSAYQDIDISQGTGQIDAGLAKFALGGWLGGYSSQNDQAKLTVTFQEWSGKVLGTASIGPVLAADRNSLSGLVQRSASGNVPAGTRMAHVQLDMTRTDGVDNDGIADSLTLILTSSGGVPTISANGVASAAAFGGSKTIAPGSWIEIYGQNLAPDSRSWAGTDFAGASAPTALDGVKVTIGGQPAYVAYISAGQVNAQVPSGVGNGQQNLVVSTGAGSSAPYPITVASTQPGVLAPASFTVSGKVYAAALFPDNVTFALPPNALPGVVSKYAKPGDTLILYGIGFGPTTPNINAGQVVSAGNSLAMQLTVSFGGVPTTLTYMGLAPSFVGLYQFNMIVPNVANGDFVPLSISLAGVPIGQTVYTAIHN
jgi:uncharacterized protein (TIGR03437 family)